jgi:hypothetical protein
MIPPRYNDNAGYREALRQFFKMDTDAILENMRKKYADFDTFDDETRDELLFDTDAVEAGMNSVFDKTRDVPMFHELYVAAAGAMLSENPDIGLAVLMSYDYFADFAVSLTAYFEAPETLGDCEAWLRLRNRLLSK